MRTILLLFGLTFFIVSCKENNKQNLSSPELHLNIEGPIYEGANTAIGVWQNPLNKWLLDQKISKEQVKDIKVVKVKFESMEGLSENDIKEITLQLTAKSASMQKIAFISPYPKNTGFVELNVAKEQDKIKELFFSEELTIVADIDLNKDFDENLKVKVIMEIEITYHN